MNTHYRHGDLILGVSSESLEKLEKVGTKRYVLAEGETTGHKHLLTAVEGTVDIYKDPVTNELVVVVDGKASIVHEEHKTIELPTGTYRMKHQQEYDYFAMQANQVID